MRVYLVRHGETDWNQQNRFQGWSDQPLSKLGVLQAHELRKRLSAISFDAVYSSDLQRARKTAEIMVKAKGVVLDMDGVLIDSMPYYAAAWRTALAEWGVTPPEVEFYRRESEGAELSIAHFFKAAGKNPAHGTVEAVTERIREVYERFPKMAFTDGAIELCRALKKDGRKLCVVTGSSASDIANFIAPEVLALFDATVSSEDYSNFKPDPEPYLLAVKRLGLEPDETIAIENAPFGIQSAKSAGLLTIALTSTLPSHELSQADLVIDRLARLYSWFNIKPC